MPVLGDTHRPDEDGGFGLSQHPGKVEHHSASRTRMGFQQLPRVTRDCGSKFVESTGMAGDKLLIDPVVVDHMLDCAGDEGPVAAGVNLEEVVGHSGSEQSALGGRGHPIQIEAGLSIRVYDDYASSFYLGEVDVLGGDRLIVGGIASEQDQQVSADPIAV